MVASLGINYSEFHAEIPERLSTVGYASSMSLKTYGVELKRGWLAEEAARDAGLAFKVAGSTGNQTSFHDMPDFYKSVDAVVISSISEAAALPVMEAAAAGRLVIGTPVGHFPMKAYQGGEILAPIEPEKFKAFTTATLEYYMSNPAAYFDKCHMIQKAALKFDWEYSIAEWIELIEGVRKPVTQLLASDTAGAHSSGILKSGSLDRPTPTMTEMENIFSQIYEEGVLVARSLFSGPGSSLAKTAKLRKDSQRYFDRLVSRE